MVVIGEVEVGRAGCIGSVRLVPIVLLGEVEVIAVVVVVVALLGRVRVGNECCNCYCCCGHRQ